MQIGTAAYGLSMDPGHTAYDDLPGRLHEEMRLLQHYKSIANAQVRRVVDVAVSEWQAADRRDAASAAVIA